MRRQNKKKYRGIETLSNLLKGVKIIKTLSLFSVVPFWIFACDDLRIWSRLALICIQSPWTLPCDGNYILKTDAVQTARFDFNRPARPSAVSKITTSQPGQHCLSWDLAVDKLLKTTLLWKTVRTCEGSKCDREQFSCCF